MTTIWEESASQACRLVDENYGWAGRLPQVGIAEVRYYAQVFQSAAGHVGDKGGATVKGGLVVRCYGQVL